VVAAAKLQLCGSRLFCKLFLLLKLIIILSLQNRDTTIVGDIVVSNDNMWAYSAPFRWARKSCAAVEEVVIEILPQTESAKGGLLEGIEVLIVRRDAECGSFSRSEVYDVSVFGVSKLKGTYGGSDGQRVISFVQ
jgi:hypothetical protein